jgi:hypothetical protein
LRDGLLYPGHVMADHHATGIKKIADIGAATDSP